MSERFEKPVWLMVYFVITIVLSGLLHTWFVWVPFLLACALWVGGYLPSKWTDNQASNEVQK